MLANMQAFWSIIPPTYSPFRLNVASCPAVLLAEPNCIFDEELEKMSDDKKPKRIRQKTIKVVVSEAEKKQIEESAAMGNLSASQYLRDLGLGLMWFR